MDDASAAALPVSAPVLEEEDGPTARGVRPRLHSWLGLWPSLPAIALFLLIAGCGARDAIVLNGGRLTYPLDDTYGHLAIAKNLLRHGVWGFSYLDGFSSAASSLVWPVVVAACFGLFGVHDYIPYILAVTAGAVFLVYAASVLRRYCRSGWLRLFFLFAIVYLTPLPALAATGMEHCLQAFLDVLFIDLAVRVLTGELAPDRRTARYGLPLTACLLVATRYEGLFIIAVVGLLFLCRGRWRAGFVFGAASVAVPTIFGLYSLHKGWYFLPNSLLLKGNTQPLAFSAAGLLLYFHKAYDQLLANQHILFLALGLVAALAAAARRERTFWSAPTLWLTITLAVVALHCQYAGFAWFFRYEAYLVALGLLSLGICAGATVTAESEAGLPWRRRIAAGVPSAVSLALAAICFGAPLHWRAQSAIAMLPAACHNIYGQQVQMGLFLRRFYPGKGVVANDIGAIDFLADIRLFDIYGLADVEVLRAKRAKEFDHRLVERAVREHDARVIVVYDSWAGDYGGQLPDWVPVGHWIIPNNVICGNAEVTFYAPRPALVPELTHALQAFAPSLPPDVAQYGLYRGQRPLNDTLGDYGPEADGAGVFRWVNHAVRFLQYPLDGQPLTVPLGRERDATVQVFARPTTGCTGLDLYVNSQLVDSKTFIAGQEHDWFEWNLPVKARPGLNMVLVAGHGEGARLPTDNRVLLFAVRPPRWTLAPPPAAVTAQTP